jgi:hypothetical protein
VDFFQIKGRVYLREPGLEVVVQIFNLYKHYGPFESSKLEERDGGRKGIEVFILIRTEKSLSALIVTFLLFWSVFFI